MLYFSRKVLVVEDPRGPIYKSLSLSLDHKVLENFGRLCEEDCLETALKGISGVREPCIKRQNIPDCRCKVAEGSFA